MQMSDYDREKEYLEALAEMMKSRRELDAFIRSPENDHLTRERAAEYHRRLAEDKRAEERHVAARTAYMATRGVPFKEI